MTFTRRLPAAESATGTTRPRRLRGWLALSVLASTSVVALSGTARADESDRVTDIAPHVEPLELECKVVATHPVTDRVTDHAVGIGCRWSVPTAPAAEWVRLIRVVVGAGEPREVIFRTRDLHENSHVDSPLRPGHRYAYRVQALTADGRVVSTSRTVIVGIPIPQVEPLRLKCQIVDRPAVDLAAAATRVHIGCAWSLPQHVRADTITLWRSVDGGARERVVSSHQPFPTSYRDVVPAGTERVVYAVIATRGDTLVARSRTEVVRIGEGAG